MFNRLIQKAVEQEINKRFQSEPLAPPVGYNALDVIRGGMFHWLPVPFAGTQVWCKCRTLNRTQIDACGSFGVLKLEKDEEPPKEAIIELRNSQEALVRATLMQPTFEDIEKMIYGEDNIMQAKKKQLAEIENEIEASGLNAGQKIELEKEIYRLRLFTGFVLPEDTFGFLTSWALGCDVSDMKKISHKQLYQAAVLAMNGKNDPTDHLSGIFTDRDKNELNAAAWSIYQEHQELENMGKSKGLRWIGGLNNKQ